MGKDVSSQIDVIVAGSGPGGATVARELARGGKRVLLLERGVDYRPRSYYGTYLGALVYSDRRSLLYTEEGLNIIRPLMLGGATSMFAGCAAPPPFWFKDKYGLNIDSEVEETLTMVVLAEVGEDRRVGTGGHLVTLSALPPGRPAKASQDRRNRRQSGCAWHHPSRLCAKRESQHELLGRHHRLRIGRRTGCVVGRFARSGSDDGESQAGDCIRVWRSARI